MTDRIFVESLRVPCKVGITTKERRTPQEVLVDVSLFLNLSSAAKSDNIAKTVNYKEVMEKVSGYVSSKEFTLLESVAEGVARLTLNTFPADSVRVRVRKAKYAVDPSVGVELERDRNSWSSRS